jgi:hypothetical protein
MRSELNFLTLERRGILWLKSSETNTNVPEISALSLSHWLHNHVRYSPESGHGLTHFMRRDQNGSRTRKQVNRWARGGIRETGGQSMERY